MAGLLNGGIFDALAAQSGLANANALNNYALNNYPPDALASLRLHQQQADYARQEAMRSANMEALARQFGLEKGLIKKTIKIEKPVIGHFKTAYERLRSEIESWLLISV